MPSKSTVIETTYENPGTGQRWKEIRIVEVPDDRIDYIRRRELASFYGEPEKSLVLRKNSQDDGQDEEEDEYYSSRQIVRNPRNGNQTTMQKSKTTEDYSRRSRRRDYQEDGYLGSRSGRGEPRARSERPPARGAYSDEGQDPGQYGYGGQSQGRSQYQNQNRNQNRSQVQSQTRNQNQNQGQGQNQSRGVNQNQGEDCLDKGPLPCSAQQQMQDSFIDRHFDTGWDGILSAAAGGIIGAMGVRRLVLPLGRSEEENKAHAKKNRAKTVAGAVVGAVAVNAAEKRFKVFTEEHAEGGENLATAMEFCGEGIDNLM